MDSDSRREQEIRSDSPVNLGGLWVEEDKPGERKGCGKGAGKTRPFSTIGRIDPPVRARL